MGVLTDGIKCRTIISVRTETFKRGGSFVVAKSIRTLKRKSAGFDMTDHFLDDIDDLSIIENLHECSDGEYEMVYSGISKDWETGETEWDGYRLIPVQDIITDKGVADGNN